MGTKLKFYDVIKCPNILLDNFKTKSCCLNLGTLILRYLIASLNCVSLVLVLILIGDHEKEASSLDEIRNIHYLLARDERRRNRE